MTAWPEAGAVEDQFLAQEATFAFHGARLRFQLARSLFSSAGVDAGSALLLRCLQDVGLAGGERVVDIGSGSGVLGVVLQALEPGRQLISGDRDALACRYTRRNVALNGLDPGRHEIVGSLGFDGLADRAPFDLIVSNVPGKAGQPFVEHLVTSASSLSRPDALLAVVVVQPLAPVMTTALERNQFEIVLTKGNKSHLVVIARPGSTTGAAGFAPGFESGVYDRQTASFASGSVSWKARTVIGLTEFDSLAFTTRLLRSALSGVPAGPSLVVNAGQGHRALISARAGYPPTVLLGRDLLALRAGRRLLVDAGEEPPELVHDITVEAVPRTFDHGLIVAHADDKVLGPWFFDQVRRYLDRLAAAEADGPRDLVLTGKASLLGRVEADILRRHRGHIAFKESQRGFRALRFRPTGR